MAKDTKFKKGHDPRRCKGRQKGSKNRYSITELWDAIKVVEGSRGKKKKLLVAFVEQAYDNPAIMVALMKKLLPDLKAIEGMIATFESSMTDKTAAAIQDKLKERFE